MPPSTRTACFARVTAANFCFFLTFASFFLLPLHVRALGGTERTIGVVMGTSGLAGLVSVLAVGAQLVRLGGFPALFVAASVFSAVGLAVAWPLPDDAPARIHAALPLRATAELSTAIATVACCGVAFGAVITYVPTFVQDAALG